MNTFHGQMRSSISNKALANEKYYPDSDENGKKMLLRLDPADGEFKLPW